MVLYCEWLNDRLHIVVFYNEVWQTYTSYNNLQWRRRQSCKWLGNAMPVVPSRGVPLDMDRIGGNVHEKCWLYVESYRSWWNHVFLIVFFFFLYESWFVLYLILYILYTNSWEGPGGSGVVELIRRWWSWVYWMARPGNGSWSQHILVYSNFYYSTLLLGKSKA